MQDIIMIGFMGAGKTTVGQALAKDCGMTFEDTDQLIEKKAGMAISELFSTQGEEVFRKMETDLIKELIEKKAAVPAAGARKQPADDGDAAEAAETGSGADEMPQKNGTVYSVGGGLPMREENRELLKKLGKVVYLTITPDTVLERLNGDTTRPLLAGDNVRERVESLLSFRDPLYREASHLCVAVDGKAVSRIVEEIKADFRQN